MKKTEIASFGEKEFSPESERIEQLLNEFYQQKEQLTPEAIKEIKEELAEISAVLINFDETMTKESTVMKVMAALGLSEEKRQGLQEFIEAQSKVKPEEKRSIIQYFYQEVLKGVKEEDLCQAYQEVIKETEINHNLDKVLEFLKKQRRITTPLFLLSLNNKDLLRMYCKANKDFFDKHGVKIIGVAGNQAETDEAGDVIGIIENATNQNKKDFVPGRAIMLADRRETKALLTKGVNAVNIQGERYNEELLLESIKYIEDLDLSENLKRMRKENPDTPQELDDIIQKLVKILEDGIKLRLSVEENKSIDLSKSLIDIKKRRLKIRSRLEELNIIVERREQE